MPITVPRDIAEAGAGVSRGVDADVALLGRAVQRGIAAQVEKNAAATNEALLAELRALFADRQASAVPPASQWLSTRDIAARLSIDEVTAARLCKRELIDAEKTAGGQMADDGRTSPSVAISQRPDSASPPERDEQSWQRGVRTPTTTSPWHAGVCAGFSRAAWWHFHFKDLSGKWVSRSTGHRDKRGATRWAEAHSLQLTDQQFRHDSPPDDNAALVPAPSVGRILALWLRYHREQSSEETLRTYRSIARKLLRFLRERGIRDIAAMTRLAAHGIPHVGACAKVTADPPSITT